MERRGRQDFVQGGRRACGQLAPGRVDAIEPQRARSGGSGLAEAVGRKRPGDRWTRDVHAAEGQPRVLRGRDAAGLLGDRLDLRNLSRGPAAVGLARRARRRVARRPQAQWGILLWKARLRETPVGQTSGHAAFRAARGGSLQPGATPSSCSHLDRTRPLLPDSRCSWSRLVRFQRRLAETRP